MTPFLAIVKLTCKSALRSHIFQFLLCLLAVCVAAVPNTIAGDGTAWGFIQISLKYSLGAVAFVLSLSTVWLGCFAMTRDAENYQLHMLLSKPVSRVTVWLGKCAGVLLINAALLLISCAAVYVMVLWQYKHQSFSDREKRRIDNEVLVARRVFMPERPDIDSMSRKVFREKVAAAKAAGQKIDESPEAVNTALKDIQKQIAASLCEARFGPANSLLWEYKGLPAGLDAPVYLRYRAYVGKVASSDQRQTWGVWGARVTAPVENPDAKKDKTEKGGPEEMKTFIVTRTQYPEPIMCGAFNEITMNPKIISPEGTAGVAFTNLDPEGKTLFFQVADGPKLLVKTGGFGENYLRSVLMIFLRLCVLAGLACAAGAFLSMPTAIFMTFSYLLFGSLTSYLLAGFADVPPADFIESFSNLVGGVLNIILIPMQSFEVSDLVSNGELIELSYMGRVFLKYFVLRGLPLFLLGILLYKRREFGLVVRK
jgi:hypothetical protein